MKDKFVLNSLLLKYLNKHVALQNLSIYYTWKYVRRQYKNKKLKIIAPKLNNEFELPDGTPEKIMKHCPLILLFIFTSTGLIIN